ncbi:MAG: methionine synthase [Bacillota bacterium]
MELEKLFGLATGIGSLPYTATAEALGVVFTYCKAIPHWPQLPRRNTAEGFAAQYLAPLFQRQIVSLGSNGASYFCRESRGWDDRVLQFYELLLAVEADGTGLEEFAFPPASAAGFYAFLENWERFPAEALCLKGQLSGPVTVGFQVKDNEGKPSFYNPSLREILVKTLAAQARWQAGRLAAAGLPALVFIDDPGLYCFGSSSAVGLGRETIQEALAEVIAGIRAGGGLVGAHCCAGTDWSLLFELPLDLVSFDAYEYFPSMQVYASALDRFLKRGGALAWGIVPTSEKAAQEDAASLTRLLDQKIETLVSQGVNQTRVRRQKIITPACGTATLSPDLAERIYRLTAALAGGIR